jgi:hypothetical protein
VAKRSVMPSQASLVVAVPAIDRDSNGQEHSHGVRGDHSQKHGRIKVQHGFPSHAERALSELGFRERRKNGPHVAARLSATKKEPRQGLAGPVRCETERRETTPRLGRTLALIAAEIKACLWKQVFFELRCCFWVTPKQSENAYNLAQLKNRN